MYIEPVNDLNLENLYELSICTPINNYFFDGNPLPFFGEEGIIVSLKSFYWGSRGVRTQSKDGKHSGALKGCVSLDYQFNGKNNNLKPFRNVVQIAGLSSEENGIELINSLISTLKVFDRAWKPFFLLSVEERQEFITDIILKIVFDDEENLLTTSNPLLKSQYKKVCEYFNEQNMTDYIDSTRYIVSFLDFHTTKDEYLEKLNTLIFLEVNDQSVFTTNGKLEFENFRPSRGIYNGEIPYKDIILEFVVKKLLADNVECSFSNEKCKEIKIISYTGLENGMLTPDSLIHQITLSSKGTVKVISPGKSDLVFKATKMIIDKIYDILQDEEYPQKSKRQIQINIRNLLNKRNEIDISDFYIDENENGEYEL